MGKRSENNRKIVLEILMEMEAGNVKLNNLLKNALEKIDYEDRQDKAFITRLTKGCIERKYSLDYVIGIYGHTVKNKMKPVIRNILRMGIYQILYMEGVKDYAACSESVNLTKARGLSGLANFVNGVLRNIARDKDNIKWPDKTKERKKYMSIYYSVPEWMVAYYDERFGPEKTEIILKSYNEPAPITIRINELLPKKVVDQSLDTIKLMGVNVERHPYLETAYMIDNIENIASLPGFDAGVFTIQDVSSQLCVALAGIEEGDIICDVCAAPGGKTMYAALLTSDEGKVYARDVSYEKLELIEENAKRLRLDNIECKVFDGTKVDESMIGKCDVVIVDAPCSGLGVIGRKPDIRYNASLQGISSLQEIQRSILDASSKYVKEGGILIYSTCTITAEENDDNRDYIINELGFKPYAFDDITEELAADIDMNEAANGYISFLPGIHKCDGFYISRYKK